MRINFSLLGRFWQAALPLLLLLCSSNNVNAQLSYCVANNTDANGAGSYIANVTFGSINNTTGSTYPTNGYSYFPGYTTTVILGTTENLTVTIDNGSNYSGAIVSVWFDWNQDGVFSASEWTQVGTNIPSGTSQTIAITIPATAIPGVTRMRIRSRGAFNQNGANDACISMGSGDTEDYDITVSAGTPCSGTPTAGSIAPVVPDSVCPNVSFALSTTGTTIGIGMSYQWQTATSASGPWTDIAGATNLSYSVPGITSATYYRLKVACNNGTPQYTNAKEINIKSFIDCYCTPSYNWGCSNGSAINSFSTTNATANITNNNSGCASGIGYSDYTGMTVSAMQGTSFDFSTQITNYSGGVKIWIDWNQDGVFDATTELVASSTSTITAGNTFTGTINVPVTALPGATRMRVRVVESSTTFDPCGSFSYGETEDYTMLVISAAPCTNPPTAGNVAGVDSVCPNTAFTLSGSGFSVGSGMTYQWQSASSAAGPWTDIAGATNTSLISTGITTATYYRLKVVCSNGTPEYTPAKAVTIKSVVNCYCIPTYDEGCSWGDDIDGVTLVGATVTLSNLNTPCSPSGYTDYTTSTTLGVPDLMPGNTYSGTVTTNYSDQYENVTIWIDYNNDGVFDPIGEQAATFGPISNTVVGNYSITVPSTASAGIRRMRVMLVYYDVPTDPCGYNYFGETHDYLVQIGPGCTIPPVNLGADTSFCEGQSITLDAGAGTGLTYLWSNNATTQSITVTTSGTYSVEVSDGTCSQTDEIVITVNPLPVVDLGNDTTDCQNGGPITLTAPSGNYTYLWSTNATTASISATTSGTYSVTVTDQNTGCAASDTVNVVIGTAPSVGGITVTGTSPTYNFSANNPANVSNYFWQFGNGATSTDQDPTYTYPTQTIDQTYIVTLIVSNECGADTVETSVIVRGNSINELAIDAQTLKMYPNPTSGMVMIENESAYTMKQVVITNVLGQQVMVIPVNSKTEHISVSNLTPGLYHVRIEFEEGVVTRKLEVLK